jgi:hypothetical protein
MQGLPRSFGARRRGTILVLALVVFWVAQAMAIAHASRHLGSDAPGLPGDHSQLCTDCAFMVPLLVVAGGVSAILFSASRLAVSIAPPIPACAAQRETHRAFRSRAPPR